MLIFAADPAQTAELAAWAAERIPHMHGGDFGPCVAGGVVRGSALAAAVVFHDWQPQPILTMQVSIASDTPAWASRDVIAGMLRYPFKTAKAYTLWAAIPHDAGRTLRFIAGLGFKKDGVLRHRFGRKRHAAVFSMTYHEWRASRWAKD